MEKLLASSPAKTIKLYRGAKVTGTVVSKTDKDLTLDIGAKAEGVLLIRDLPVDQRETVKAGDKIEAFVVLPENESGQVTLSLFQSIGRDQKIRGVNWNKFQNAQNKKSRIQGKVLEINKGGLIVEVEGVRGFLPNSQVGFELLSNLKMGLETLIGQTVNVTVAEVDLTNNRLIFTQRGHVSSEALEKLKAFKSDQSVSGKIVAVLPFGLVIDLNGIEGLVFISDVSWDKVDNLALIFQVGQEVEAKVLGIDEELGRVNLSMKHLTEDPFSKIAENYPADQVVKGEVESLTEAGVMVKFKDGVEGLLPASKMDPDIKYEAGNSMSFLVDSVDLRRRRVNLAPFVTSTEGLIYK